MGPGMKLERMLTVPAGKRFENDDLCGESYWFWCNGCETHHAFRTRKFEGETKSDGKTPAPVWTFNGNLEKPSFAPSLLYKWSHEGKDVVCHLFLRDGILEYLSDCTHKLAGKRVPLGELPT